MGNILLYYKYVAITDPVALSREQRELCTRLGLTGRIIIAHEGINGTVGGSLEAAEHYQQAMHKNPLFSDMEFKISEGGSDCFPRLTISVKEEIVHLGISPKELSADQAGDYLSPKQVHELINEQKENLVLLDTRNTYETAIGTFKNALIPPIENFRDLPAYIDAHQELFKNKEVVMFCTGGVRCERATAYLKTKGIADKVYHIKGGIVRYTEAYPDGHFRGKNYVFDGRVSVQINNDIIGKCQFCATPFDDCSNCVNTRCNNRMLSCPDCSEKYYNSCSTTCADLIKNSAVPVRTIPARVSHA
jgi:predicted sulfurtransferase